MQLSMRWAARCVAAHGDNKSALFGIVQGGMFEKATRGVTGGPYGAWFRRLRPGRAFRRRAQGRDAGRIVEFCGQRLPAEKPRYLMGVGTPADIVHAVSEGIDMFDCVMPTRNARNAHIFTSQGLLRLRNSRFRNDTAALDAIAAATPARISAEPTCII